MKLALKREYMKEIYSRYHESSRKGKGKILDEFCKVYKCHRKHAIRALNRPLYDEDRVKRKGKVKYLKQTISIIESVWEALGYLWSVRLKEALKIWIPYIRKRFKTTDEIEQQILTISAAQIDRRLKPKKYQLRKRIYGTTKPGAFLKQHIVIKTSGWDCREPGWLENDLVSYFGSNASGDFAYTLNAVDIASNWTSQRAILGKSQRVVCSALDEIIKSLPFSALGIDSDNGSEFINAHLLNYCDKNKLKFTRSREYKKNDNAHIEQKNFTHVRKIVGYARYDTQDAVDAMNELYKNELDLFQNLFQPSMKLQEKVRVGSKVKRVYDDAKTPLDRLIELNIYNKDKVAQLLNLRQSLDPFELSQTIEQKLKTIYDLANKSVRVAFCPRNVYRPQIASPCKKRENYYDYAMLSNAVPDVVSKFKQIYQKEVELQLR